MLSAENTIETLNDLVEIHNDRITGYEKAIDELKQEDAELKSYFLRYISQSQQQKAALTNEIQALNGNVETGTTASGKLYRAWMDIKAAFTGRSEHTILSNAEFGEDAAQKAYNTALNEELPENVRQLIIDQKSELLTAHNEVKRLRDAQPA